MFAKLTALVSSSPTFPYQLGDPYDDAWGCSWTHYKATKKEDGSVVSVFKLTSENAHDRKLVAARNGVKRLRMVRHPNVLAFKDTLEVEEKGSTSLYVVTEPVEPLTEVLQQLDIQGQAREEYIAMGLFHVAKAVSFLNNDCKQIHGNICMRAIVVTQSLDWRLHGFDLLSEHQPATGFEWPLMAATWMVGAQYKPAEVGKADWQAVQQGPPWAVDAWGLGCLIQEAYRGRELTRTEELRDTSSIPKSVLPDYQRLLASQSVRRLNPAKVCESAALKTKLVDTIAFLESLAVKDSNEKDIFFKRLPVTLPSLPLPVVQRKLLPMLASALEYGGAPSLALGALLQIGKTLDADAFAAQVVPVLSKLFTSNDRTIRRSLLESIDTYGTHFSESVVESQVYPHVATGFSDSNAYLRELTLKSMLVLAPKLSQKTLTQSLLKFLAKLQVDEEPAIRANTTILLGNLASYLSESACKRVLLNAFTRALKDSFPPARVAGVKALQATAQRYSPEEVAVRAVPALAPLSVDAVAQVRRIALSAMQSYIKILAEHADALDAAATAAVENGDASAAATQQAGGTWGSSSGLGWAISSIGLSRPAVQGTMGSAAWAGSAAAPAAASASAAMSPSGSMAAPQAMPSQHRNGAAIPEPSAAGEGDGWDSNDDEAFDDMEDEKQQEIQERMRRLNTRSTHKARPPRQPLTGDIGLERQTSFDSEASLASSQSQASNMTTGSAVGAAEQARRSHVGVPARAKAQRGRGGLASRSAGGTGMKLNASKLGASKLGNPEDFFDF
ncbi:hypothetical protein CVIRNUC_001906 [Coccomyxa viridis]|uniref:Protein kinase domain-containing protein n=1 Tax=Coccomyxa viridis TaxID=1274662 RepID=A0AAV1HWZ2_9CHLO|nr:hypothetical protein CVIRNUC_001906 [Coccomyxa viridis]